MNKVAATSFGSCKQHAVISELSVREWKIKLKRQEWQCHAVPQKPKSKRSKIKNQMATKPATYSSRLSTDIPLYESPGVTHFFFFVNHVGALMSHCFASFFVH